MTQPASLAGVPAVDNPQLPTTLGNGNAGTVALLDAIFDVKGAKARLANLKNFFQEMMEYTTDGRGDYGILPGTTAVALYKPGAEKLCEFYRLIQRPTITHRREDWDVGFFHYEAQMDLLSRDSGQIMGTGLGSCNSMESRYRWRTAKQKCPKCRGEFIFVSTKDGPEKGSFYCWNKKGGCGATFAKDDKAITEQELGRVENDDVYSLVNTILKMSKKRALVDGVVSITRSAGLLVVEGRTPKSGNGNGSGSREAGGNAPRAEATVVDTITEDDQKAMNAAATQAGHKWADVVAYARTAHDVDLTKTRVPKAIHAALLERVSKAEALVPAQGELGK